MKKKPSFFAIVLTIVIVLLVAAAIALVLYFTNNFSTEMTSFYVQYGSKEIRRDTGGMQFEKGVYYTFKVNYPFGVPSGEKGERYKVSVEVNEVGDEIEYLVDESYKWLYSESLDLTSAFEIQKGENDFTFCIPEGMTLANIFAKAYGGKEVTVLSDHVDFSAKDYFSLVVKSYDESAVIRIGFGFDEHYFANDTINDGVEHYIIFDTLGSGSMKAIKFDCKQSAKAGEKVSFNVSLVDLSEEFDDYTPLKISRITVTSSNTGDGEFEIGSGEGTFSFLMPTHDVTILFYLTPEGW